MSSDKIQELKEKKERESQNDKSDVADVDPKVVEQQEEAQHFNEPASSDTLQDRIDKLPPKERRYAEILMNRGFDLLEVQGVDPDKVVRWINIKKENFDMKRARGWVPVSRAKDGSLKEIEVGADQVLNQLDTTIRVGDLILCTRSKALQAVIDEIKLKRQKEALGLAEEGFRSQANRIGVEVIEGAPGATESHGQVVDGQIGQVPVGAPANLLAGRGEGAPMRDKRIMFAKKSPKLKGTIFSVPGMTTSGKKMG